MELIETGMGREEHHTISSSLIKACRVGIFFFSELTFAGLSHCFFLESLQAPRIRTIHLKAILRQDVGYFDLKVSSTSEVMNNVFNDSLKQGIAIPRAILKNPIILLLDKATNTLDGLSEKAVQGALNRVIVGRTNVVVGEGYTLKRPTHRVEGCFRT
ncbi:hypothetical protein EJ110_NYTH01642 [Nymphaea thermarum]|nr:hypothetical protein EJ110_NYTH01642 [Nymphaea thermarum]